MLKEIFFVPVGPKDTKRVRWTVGSIRKFETDYKVYLLLDGVNPDQLADGVLGSDTVVILNPAPTGGHLGLIWSMQMAGMVQALHRAEMDPECIFVKIDCDAVLMRPGFGRRARDLFRTRPHAGLIGNCFTNIVGGRLSNRGWEDHFRRSCELRGLIYFLRSRTGIGASIRDSIGAWWSWRSLIRDARQNGYTFGEFPLGGCYALRPTVIGNLEKNGTITKLPARFIPKIAEDVLMGPLVYVAGFSEMDDTCDDGLFSVYTVESPIDPLSMKSRGHYVFHPFKYGVTVLQTKMTEDELADALTRS